MKKTKFALLQSVIALLLCCSMLIGTTFAWFTDSVTSGNNIIAAGNLDIELEYLDGSTWKKVNESTNVFKNDTLWEPGHTEVVYLKVSNAGTLALKYQLGVNIAKEVGSVNQAGESFLLSDYIYFGAVEGVSQAYADRAAARAAVTVVDKLSAGYTKTGTMEKGAEPQYVALVVYMPEETGNAANYATGATPPSIDLGIALTATQMTVETDSFGTDYDSTAQFPTLSQPLSVTANVQVDANGCVAAAVSMTDSEGMVTAQIPAGVKLAAGVSQLTLRITEMETSGANLTLEENEIQRSLDVHIEGIAPDNTVPVEITIGKAMMIGLNIGNYTLYHVENGQSNPMTAVAAVSDLANHNDFYYDPATGDVTVCLATFSEVAAVANTENAWKGEFDYTWYTGAASNARDGSAQNPYLIANADQLAAFGAIVGGMNGQTRDSFAGKTVKLIADINLGDKDDASKNLFYPIGYYNDAKSYTKPNDGTATVANVTSFQGTFDGNGHTISNFYQNTWQMWGDYDGNNYKAAMGLFGYVVNGTVKNLTVDHFSSDGEFTPTGVIAAYAVNSTFENIAITNCNPRVYNTGNGGIIGVAGRENSDVEALTLTNITVDNSNKITALWGSWDVACGGLVGMYRGNADANGNATGDTIHFENCHVSVQIDVYNDVCANYQYYAYRYSGMIIGSVRHNTTSSDGKSIPNMAGISATGCTVHFGDWNDYYYCELVANSLASYTHDHQMSRLEQVASVDAANKKIVTLKGEPKDIPTSGRVNYVVVKAKDANGMWIHGDGHEYAECYHFVNGVQHKHDVADNDNPTIYETVDGNQVLKEDKQLVYREFNNLFTGYGWGVTSKGLTDFKGVENMDITQSDHEKSVEKFEGKKTELANNKEYKLGDIFTFVDKGVELIPGALTVTVTNQDENNPVSAEFMRDEKNWENGTITFTGTGKVTITIQDYYFCIPTVIEVEITARAEEEKFDIVMNNGDFLHRVGNDGKVALDKLFKAKENVSVGTVSVTVEAVNGSSASGTYSNNAIQFDGTGVVKVTIKDDDKYCASTELYLEVVDAVNATGATDAKANNVVLLNDCGLSSLSVSDGYTFYGNGFTMTYTGDGRYLGKGSGFKFGVVNVSDGGRLDNCRIVCSVYPIAALYSSQIENYYEKDGDKTRYFYQLSAVAISGNSAISNSYIYGGRNNVYVGSGNVLIEDTVLECGTVSNVQVVSSNEYTVTLNGITTIQKQVKPTTYANDSLKNNVMLGFGVLIGDGDADTVQTNPNVVLTGAVKQYNWVSEEDKNAVSDSYASAAIDAAVSNKTYQHTVNGKTVANLGVVILNNEDIEITNKTGLPYQEGSIKIATVTGQVYSLSNAKQEQIYSDVANADRVTENDLYQPQFKINDDLGGQCIEKTEDGDEFCYKEDGAIKVMFPVGESKELDLASMVNIVKYSGQDLGLTISCKDSDGNVITVNDGKVKLSEAGDYIVTYTVTDNLFYDKEGNVIGGGNARVAAQVSVVEYSWDVVIAVSLKEISIPNAYFEFDSSVQEIFRSGNSNIVQFIPFLSGLKIYDYDENGNKYLRFDGGNTESTTDYSKITSATIDNINTTGEAQGYHIVTIELKDGGKIVIDMDVRANSGSSKHSGSIKVRNNVIYVVNDGTTSGRGQTWKIYSYKFVGNNGTEINSGAITFGTGTDCEIATKPTSNFGSSSGDSGGGSSGGGSDSCVAPGTLITLADGTKVPVETLTGKEELLVWNLETGKFDSAPIMFVDSEEKTEVEVIHLYFSDGTEVEVIGEHGFWDVALNRYVYLDRNAAKYIGHTFVKQGNTKLAQVQLVDVVLETKVTTAWSPVTVGHLCYFVNGMLSMPGGVGGLFNIFEVDEALMAYDEAAMLNDIEKYGLFTYEELNAIAPLSEDMFNAAGGAYLKISIGKGNLTMEELIYMINRYSKYFQ